MCFSNGRFFIQQWTSRSHRVSTLSPPPIHATILWRIGCKHGLKLWTRACARNLQRGHCYTSFRVVPVFAVAFLVENPIIVDKVAREQGASVGPAPAANYISAPLLLLITRVPTGMRSGWDQSGNWNRVSKTVDL